MALDKTQPYATVANNGSVYFLQSSVMYDGNGNTVAYPFPIVNATNGNQMLSAILKELQVLNVQTFDIKAGNISTDEPNNLRGDPNLTT